MTLPLATRLDRVETSAIRELFKLLGQPGIISFAGGFPDSTLFDVAGIRAATEQALAQDPGAALQYGATEGLPMLREQLAMLMRARGVAGTVASDLIVTTGSQQALDLVGKTLIDAGTKAIVEGPTFLATIQCFRLYGADLISAPVDGDGIRPEPLEALLAQHRPRLLYLIPSFGNPSGAMLSLARRLRVLELAVKYDTLIVEDDPYGELYFDAPAPPSLLALSAEVPGSRDRIVHCASLSKVLSPGLRVGWMMAPAGLLAKATMCKQFSDAHTSTFAQAVAAHYLQSGRLLPALGRVRAAYAHRAVLMADCLRSELSGALDFTPPRGGFFLWPRWTAPGADSAVLARRALSEGVALVPGAPFYCGQPDPACFRLSFATVGDDGIREGVQRLARALQAPA